MPVEQILRQYFTALNNSTNSIIELRPHEHEECTRHLWRVIKIHLFIISTRLQHRVCTADRLSAQYDIFSDFKNDRK